MQRESSQFLRALRGHRSQGQLARRLGYRGNPITDWERGERYPTAQEALRAAALVGIDVHAAFTRFAPGAALEKRDGEWQLGSWLSTLRGETPMAELAQRAGCSRFSVARWLHGSAKPRLPDFFRLLDAITHRLPEWVAALVAIEDVPLLSARYDAGQAAKHLAFEVPWSEAVLRLLETRGYRTTNKKREQYLASALGIELADVQTCLARLQTAGVVEKQRGRFVVREQGAVDTQGGKQALHRLKQHWTQVASARLTAPREGDYFAYNVVSVSSADLDRIRERLRVAFREIRSMVAASQPEEAAALINLQVVTFGEE